MPFETWLLYLITCCGIAVVPGPNALLALTHGAIHGSRRTLFTISGGVLGFALVLTLCAVGLGALIQASATWFMALKIAGGLYLIWLGFGLWRSAPVSLDTPGKTGLRRWSLFRQGLVSALSNPKALLLFTAFIPPFLDPHRSLIAQTAAIALTYAVVEFFVEYMVASAAHRVRPWLARTGRRFNKICGGFFVLFGLALPIHS
ncbi:MULTISPECIES: LysE family translocator [Pseudomonas]|uniref:LysE family translocator n=1 Tax=Pseudomonas tritici TaxID=2745518 RepID=A0A8I0D226_9PSED|nr:MULTISPECIES: LysE family translocator [Pseudomonas]MBP2871037.1 LysE family translocator [Pseudomonas sp. SWRI144]QXH86667.1 LysE family translocator [Pseudomonas tritici]CRM28211.1 Homoserine/homoserine lactone efflux protein [Pseudomonas sp. 24 E 1]CRM45510.1 Homoserine/homoserine lactone efflux protein [Pseudomonas sp. 52 E 6]CRM47134.1 Homoserine/homoserine lactone efflux protein [Pseudomonas sp. 35 E 8]